eukprot:TRINITY_DN76_c0_g1_i1.p1 TRINITY_DN76_c0_g1~~TRINITY_DN76_c0_g1_i1.p1  ORF type:complete len:349 (+),score=85.92 TRINITY_DN76_c0_g1_i1:51-1097(+)
MGSFLSQPLSSKLLQRSGNKYFRVGEASMQGWRDNMEDAHTIQLQLENHGEYGFFAVYDGHCGSQASRYCSDNLYKYIDNVSDLSDLEAITSVIINADKDFMNSVQQDDGTTAVILIVKIVEETVNGETNIKYELTSGNIGDSRIVLAKGGTKAVALTFDHKPNDTIERTRIQEAGGHVSMNRVRGNLALSRAIGDRSYKVPADFPPDKHQVICIPDYIQDVATGDDWVLLACDGIYEADVFTRESVVAYIEKQLKETDDLAVICSRLLDECLERGSKDNMSAILLQFQDGTDYSVDEVEYVPGPYYEGYQNSTFQEAYRQYAEANGFSVASSRELYKKSNPDDTEHH